MGSVVRSFVKNYVVLPVIIFYRVSILLEKHEALQSI